MKHLLKALGLDAVYGCDWETFWGDDYTLRKIPMTEYITDPRFETQIVSVQKDSWAKPKVMEVKEFIIWARSIKWSRTGFLAHNAAFDALIASHHFGIRPKFYFDTMSMAKPLMPVQVGGSLVALCAAFGREAKKFGASLQATKNRHWHEFSAAEKKTHKLYAGDDIADTWFLFNKLEPYTQLEELRLIDLTIKMYAQPTVLLDKALLQRLAADTIEKKRKLLATIQADKSLLMSNDKFAVLLRAHGVEPPLKISKTTNLPTYAFSKQDQEFKDLLQHDDEEVRLLVEARLGVKSTIVETRAQRMADRAGLGPQPIALKYWGAKTGRWSGTDSINWQNMSRGSDMRKAIHAPPGYSLIIADLAQIEARLNAWCAGQQNIVDAFANKEDVYALAASLVYGRPINKDDNPTERFVGKVMVLALGYQAGWSRFADMLRIGAFGPPIDISDALAKDVHAGWRAANPCIVASWKRALNSAKSAFFGRQRIEDGVIVYEGHVGKGITHLPNGTYIRYDGLECDEDGMSYLSEARGKKRDRLYGGKLVENNTQALARIVIAEHMLRVVDELKMVRIAMSTHDEIVCVVPNRSTAKALRAVKAIMSTPPSWAPDLPLGVDAHASQRYDK